MPNKESVGYSGTPLVTKLGVKPGFRVKVRNEPENYGELLGALPDGVVISRNVRGNVDLWHLFTASEKELHQVLLKAKREIQQAGMIWVSWPKKSSGVASEITEDTIRDYALTIGLVDVKVCAVDATWSGLKLVIPVKDRTQK